MGRVAYTGDESLMAGPSIWLEREDARASLYESIWGSCHGVLIWYGKEPNCTGGPRMLLQMSSTILVSGVQHDIALTTDST